MGGGWGGGEVGCADDVTVDAAAMTSVSMNDTPVDD